MTAATRRPYGFVPFVATALAALGAGYLFWSAEPHAAQVVLYLVCFALLFIAGPFGVLCLFVCARVTRVADFVPLFAEIGLTRNVAFVGLAAFGAHKVMRQDLSWAKVPQNRWLIVLLGAAFVSVFWSSDRAVSQNFFVDVLLKIGMAWVLLVNLIDTKRRAITFQVLIALMIGGLATYAIAGKLFGFSLMESRAGFVGLLGNPNDLALTLLMAVPFCVEATLSCRSGKRYLFLAIGVLAVIGIFTTQSRGAILGLAAGAYVMMRTRTRSQLVAVFGVVVVAAALFVLSGVSDRATFVTYTDSRSGQSTYIDTSSRGRLDAWYAGARMLAYNPLTGVGLNQVTENFGVYAVNPADWRNVTSHNAFVECAAETGLIGIFGFCMLWLTSLLSNRKLTQRIPGDASDLERAFLKAQLPNLVCVMVAAVFLSVAWYWFPYLLFAQAATAGRVWLGSDLPRLSDIITIGRAPTGAGA